MSETAETSQSPMGPYVAMASAASSLKALTAVCRSSLLVNLWGAGEAGGEGGGGDGEGGGGDGDGGLGGGRLGDGGGGDGDGGGGDGDGDVTEDEITPKASTPASRNVAEMRRTFSFIVRALCVPVRQGDDTSEDVCRFEQLRSQVWCILQSSSEGVQRGRGRRQEEGRCVRGEAHRI